MAPTAQPRTLNKFNRCDPVLPHATSR